MEIGTKAIAKLAERYGTQYQIGNIAEAICKFCRKLRFLNTS